ncbi:MAG: deoxyhypusine synthase family protein, partial [Patescibacteria group bacterium]
HDLHFAFGLPVKQGSPDVDDNDLRDKGVTRIYDIYIDEEKTLKAQDEIIRDFCRTLKKRRLSSPDFNYELGKYVLKHAKHPERSFVAMAAKYGVPIFWDSPSNHSIAMNIAVMTQEGIRITIDANLDVIESAAIVFNSKATGFVELGGGGPKNFIQQTSPTVSQIFKIPFEGADRGLQITTDQETNAGLSGCTFKEGVSWGKYKDATKGLVQITGEYSTIFPLIAGYVIEVCNVRTFKNIIEHKKEMRDKLEAAAKAVK